MTILFDNEPVKAFVPESLPMLIHGAEGSGASFYTICLAAAWCAQGTGVLFLCGYPMAEEAFDKIADRSQADISFFTKEKTADFLKALASASAETIVCIKNAELFGRDIIEAVAGHERRIISGDIQQSGDATYLSEPAYATRVFFSAFPGIDTSRLKKHEGLVMSGNVTGITTLA